MKLVVDANCVLAALVRDAGNRRHFYSTAAALFAPVYLREEVEKHRERLRRAPGLAADDFSRVLDDLLLNVIWVQPEVYEEKLPTAKAALGARDMKDVPYLACALAIGADGIWSRDEDFDVQTLVERFPHPPR